MCSFRAGDLAARRPVLSAAVQNPRVTHHSLVASPQLATEACLLRTAPVMVNSAAAVAEGGPATSSGPAARHVSAEAFLQAASVAWGHLRREERKAIRASCRAGRQQHDRLLCELRLKLGRVTPQGEEFKPLPPELRSSLQAAVGRGARPQSLTLRFKDERDDRRKDQLLAALEACSGCPLSRLELQGAVPLTGASVEAIEACCPQLSRLALDHMKSRRALERQLTEEEEAEYHFGCAHLLTLCGPRLKELQLYGVQRWQASSYMFLRWCTALTKLELEAGWDHYRMRQTNDVPIGSAGTEACILGAVAQLKSLRSLRLATNLRFGLAPEALRPYASCVGRLSSLTALTHLYLETPMGYAGHGNSWHEQQQEGEEHEVWCEVREAHRAALLSPLRCMPQLQQLECPTLWLRPSELPVQCTALTSLSLKGLRPPAVEAPQGAGDNGAGAQVAGAAMPPQLQELTLRGAASPRALALLRPPVCFARVGAAIAFGPSDVTPEGHVTAQAVEAVGPAVRLLAAYRGRTSGCDDVDWYSDSDFWQISSWGACGHGMMLPREGSPNGHIEWIRQLQALDVYGSLTLSGVALSFGDLRCLGQTLARLTSLYLSRCSFSLAAVPALRPHMLQLTNLEMDLTHCQDVNDGVLEAVALQVCCPLPGAVRFQRLALYSCPMSVGTDECQRSILEQLRRDVGVMDVDVEFS